MPRSHSLTRQLTQQEIDPVSQAGRDRESEAAAAPFDFRRPDRIPKSQLRSIHLLHDAFARSLVSSLSAYLRSYLTVNLVSVEQLSYAEFLDGLPSPTCMVSLGLSPHDGTGVMELNSTLVFPIIEMLLGGTGKSAARIQRDITEIEQKVLEGLFRVVIHDLHEAWKPVAAIDFSIDPVGNEPQLLHLMAPKEAVIAIGVEIRIGEITGMLNIALPSIVIKMMRQKFDQQWLVRKTLAGAAEQTRMLRMLRGATMTLETRLEGPTLKVRDLLALREGHLLVFDYPVDRPLDLRVNGIQKFTGYVVSTGKVRACEVETVRRSGQGKIKDDGAGASSPAL